MPQARYFTVREVREVKLWTNSVVEAAVMASDAFAGVTSVDVAPGAITSPPKIIGLEIHEDPKT
jgi:hypothetical protein